jgi:hypothetical protein
MKSLILILLVLVGCNASQLQEVKTFSNEATLAFNVDGLNYVGMAAIPRKKTQIIKPTLPKTAERIVFATCAGHPEFINPVAPFSFTYDPIHFVEDTKDRCIMKIFIASKEQPMSLGIIDFYGEEVTLPAWVTCNRKSLRVGGASVCQVASRDITRIVFDEPVIAEPLKDASPIVCDGAICTYYMGTVESGYLFRGLKSGAYHRHTTRSLAPLE